MSDYNFSGKWKGEYTFGEEYGEYVRGKSIRFEITMSLANGFLSGECTDKDSALPFDKPASIEGLIRDNSITFIKRYPYYWHMEEDGATRFMPKLPSQEIRYSGHFNEGKFEGEWEITNRYLNEKGEEVLYTGKGYWYMEKSISEY